jgi:NAD(P)-dependent dehydrogenase (short-subunit alcohol dehydrogenase family)
MNGTLKDQTVLVVGRSRRPARRIGTADDVAGGVLFAMNSTSLTGQMLHIDGGEPLT